MMVADSEHHLMVWCNNFTQLSPGQMRLTRYHIKTIIWSNKNILYGGTEPLHWLLMCQNVSCHCSNLFKRKLWGLCLVKSLEFLVRIIIAINHSFKLKYSIATQQSMLFMPEWTWVRNKHNAGWTNTRSVENMV